MPISTPAPTHLSTVLTRLLSLLFILNITACTEETELKSTQIQSTPPTPMTTATIFKPAISTPVLPQKSLQLPQKRPVYNQAYQENYDADSIDTILQSARNAYVLIDPFQLTGNVSSRIAAIKAQSNQIGCYISVGTGENWRSDFKKMQPYLVKKQWGEWEGEYFVADTSTGILALMKSRVDKMAAWGCDWVEFDNMDWTADDDYREEYQFTATLQDSVDYMHRLCGYVKSKQMKCMAKNTVDHYENFDGVLYESYHDEKNWWSQAGAQQFLAAGKLVIINHYNEAHCDQVYAEYTTLYNPNISFICEDVQQKKYRHYQ